MAVTRGAGDEGNRTTTAGRAPTGAPGHGVEVARKSFGSARPLRNRTRRAACPAQALDLGVMSEQPAPAPAAPSGPLPEDLARSLKRDAAGLVAAIIQQFDTGEVLMLGWMDDEALHRTMTTGRVTFYSRSRQEYWRKGDASGHVQWVKSLALDCDGDALLVRVDQVGAACHTGTRTCFDGRDLDAIVGHAG